jgi:predicted enzyme related to lactoylglutathione lyase
MSDAEGRGCFVWFDLNTSEPAAAVDFYTQLVGWGTQKWEGGGMPYTMWANGDTPLGGVLQLPEEAKSAGAPPHWIAYVAVPDVDATVGRVGELGGGVLHPPTDIPTVGRFAVIADPQGAVIAVFAPAEPGPGRGGPPQVGEFSWHELATTDREAAFDFYHELFGWEKQEAMDMGEAGIYQIYGHGEKPLGGMFVKPAEMPGPPAWLYYVKVADVDAAVAKVKELGGEVLNGPMEVPGGDRIAQCMDPQGAVFAIHSSA